MKKKLKDLGFTSILIFIIGVGIYWMIYEFKNDGLDHYINLLGERLLAMVPKEKDKQVIEIRYEAFKQNIKDKKVNPAQVEEVAANILNMSNREDTISVEEAEGVLSFAVVEPLEIKEDILLGEEPLPPEVTEIQAADHDAERWEKLEETLPSVVDFNIDIHKKVEKSARLKKKMKMYIDEDLRVFLDKDIKEILDTEKDLELQEQIIKLQEKDIIVWIESLETELDEELDKLSDELDRMLEKNVKHINRLGEIRGIDLQGIADSVKVIKEYISDSLQAKIDALQEERE
jgi:hypothetical protein